MTTNATAGTDAEQGSAGADAATGNVRTSDAQTVAQNQADINADEADTILTLLRAEMGSFFADLQKANAKRTADLAQSTDHLTTIGDLNHRQVLNNIATQALQNAVETANMVGKQAVRHSDIAIDNEWNPVQQGAGDTLTARAVSIDDASLKAIGAAIAAALASSINPKE